MDADLNEQQESQTAIDEAELSALADLPDGENEAGSDQTDLNQQIPTAELINPIINLTVNAICPNWELQNEEIDALSQSYADLLDKYFPDASNAFGVELNALLITAAIFTPRLGTPRFKESRRIESDDKQERTQEITRPGQFEGFPDERIEG